MKRFLFSWRWIFTTLLVITALGVLVRLGIWQLDRLDQRRAFNAQVIAQTQRPVLDLNAALDDPDLAGMEYRGVTVSGEYLPDEQIVMRNEVNQNEPGFHLITPLKIAGEDQLVMVDRGWIPLADADPASWEKFDQAGLVTVRGVIRQSEAQAWFGPRDGLQSGSERQTSWSRVSLALIQKQVQEPLLPVFIQMTPGQTLPAVAPIPAEVDLDLSEGSHFSYALQWFTFAIVLAAGYPFYVRKQYQRSRQKLPASAAQSIGKNSEVSYAHRQP